MNNPACRLKMYTQILAHPLHNEREGKEVNNLILNNIYKNKTGCETGKWRGGVCDLHLRPCPMRYGL